MPVPIRFLAAVLSAMVAAGPAGAASMIRDAEIERTLAHIANPILRAASVTPSSVHIYVVNDRELNAFVAGGQNIFINTGLLTKLGSIDELRAVIAHETGHIAGGHLARRDQSLQGSKGMAILGMIGAAAVTIGGSPEAGMAIAAGSQQVAKREMLSHSRGEEAAADQAGLRFMVSAGADPTAVLTVINRFAGQEALMPSQMDPYARTHPLWGDRVAMLEERVATLPKGTPPSEEEVYWHKRMVAKLEGFLKAPAQTLKTYPPSDTSETAALARAIAYHRQPDVARGTRQMEALLASRPDDPFYLELKGQFLLESGDAAGAVAAYRRAVEFAPKEPLLLGGLGRALLNTGDDGDTAEARAALTSSVRLDKANPSVLRDLALAEARLGNEGAAALATAERFAIEGKMPDAARNAIRAADLLPTGSPGWRRAQDLITMTRRVKRRN
ncbi:M48 family metalloprotease [uncultured Amaricoccus sp.]|uniref:M48 family metalloprotease n=1 Tax=uncultured Amaricoccus sp. TaxID=339341 RepID=UPI0026091C4E|nr:M48 family metalloprotease [uncultured Amaricoccus sp.]